MSKTIISLVMFSSIIAPSAVKEANFYSSPKNSIGSGSQVLRLLNVEDYIYERDPKEPDTKPDIVDQFKEYAKEKGYTKVEVSYETTDTPESMFNLLKLSENSYDLICPSDYMIQKLIVNDMLSPMNIDEEHMPNYIGNASSIKDRLDAISAVNSKTGETCYLKDYAVGYMWGTLGLLFDPEYGGRDAEGKRRMENPWRRIRRDDAELCSGSGNCILCRDNEPCIRRESLHDPEYQAGRSCMAEMRTMTYSAAETRALGEQLAVSMKPGDVVVLKGELGAGKSELTRGIAKGLGVTENVTSPSFTIFSIIFNYVRMFVQVEPFTIYIKRIMFRLSIFIVIFICIKYRYERRNC